jgi:hypothetical protein
MFATRYFNLRSFARRFFPKLGAEPDPSSIPNTGTISASGVENLIGGSVAISVIGGSIDGATPGGSMS